MIKNLKLVAVMFACVVFIKADDIQNCEELDELTVAQQMQSLDDDQEQNADDSEQIEKSFFKKHKKKIIAALVAGVVVAGGTFYLTSFNTQGRAWCKKNMPWIVWDKERENRDIHRMKTLAANKRDQNEHLELYNLFQKYPDQIDTTYWNNNFKKYVKNPNAGLSQDAGVLPKNIEEQNKRIYVLAAGDQGPLKHKRTQEENKELYKLLFQSGRKGDLVDDLFANDEDKDFREYLKSSTGLKQNAGI